uniref:CSON009217 protein n=1 Tax=Culicoides sonorensis TaxID=179676 RepID=A0A336LE90_CULSO
MKCVLIFLLLCIITKNNLAINGCVNYKNGTCTLQDIHFSLGRSSFNLASFNVPVSKMMFKNSQIPVLTSKVCEALPALNIFKANNVSMRKINADAFNACNNLTEIQLQNNLLTELDPDLFDSNSELAKVYLYENRLKAIHGTMFKNTPKLEVLSLFKNALDELSLTDFPVLPNLSILSIVSNFITELDAHQITKKFPNLTQIYIGRNLFDCRQLNETLNILNSNRIIVNKAGNSYLPPTINTTKLLRVACLQNEHRFPLIFESNELPHTTKSRMLIQYLKDDLTMKKPEFDDGLKNGSITDELIGDQGRSVKMTKPDVASLEKRLDLNFHMIIVFMVLTAIFLIIILVLVFKR